MNLKDLSTKKAKEYNWNLLVTELKRFNIKVSVDNKRKLINETETENIIYDLIDKLKEYNQNIVSNPDLITD